jgi:hypothetical protein
MFPKNYVCVVDSKNKLVDFRLYENASDARRAFQSWRIMDDSCKWAPSEHEAITYKRSDLKIATGGIPFRTFHSLSEDELRAQASGFLHYEILAAAKEYERQSLLSSDHRRSYYRTKYQYWLNALIPVAVVTAALLFIKKNFIVDPIPNLSLLISVAGFSVVAFYFYREFGSWVGAVIGAVVAWMAWGLLASILFEFHLGYFQPLFDWPIW